MVGCFPLDSVEFIGISPFGHFATRWSHPPWSFTDDWMTSSSGTWRSVDLGPIWRRWIELVCLRLTLENDVVFSTLFWIDYFWRWVPWLKEFGNWSGILSSGRWEIAKMFASELCSHDVFCFSVLSFVFKDTKAKGCSELEPQCIVGFKANMLPRGILAH